MRFALAHPDGGQYLAACYEADGPGIFLTYNKDDACHYVTQEKGCSGGKSRGSKYWLPSDDPGGRMTEDNYKVVGYKLNVPVLGQTKLTHRDRELVRRIDSLRRVPREELAKVFNVSEREIYKALEANQASVRLPALTTDKRRQQSVDLIAEWRHQHQHRKDDWL